MMAQSKSQFWLPGTLWIIFKARQSREPYGLFNNGSSSNNKWSFSWPPCSVESIRLLKTRVYLVLGYSVYSRIFAWKQVWIKRKSGTDLCGQSSIRHRDRISNSCILKSWFSGPKNMTLLWVHQGYNVLRWGCIGICVFLIQYIMSLQMEGFVQRPACCESTNEGRYDDRRNFLWQEEAWTSSEGPENHWHLQTGLPASRTVRQWIYVLRYSVCGIWCG